MDQSIPIGRWSIGLDAILGLIPGVGDVAGAFISSLIISSGVRAGLPRSAILRMVGNVAIDSLLGSLPFVGDLFDFTYKANVKNIEIYKRSVRTGRSSLKDWGFIAAIVIILMALAAIPLAAVIYLASWLRGLIS